MAHYDEQNTKMSSIPEITELAFKAEVLNSKKPVLVAFLAPWSRPCQTVRSVLEEIAAELAEKMKVATVNADDHPDLGLWYDIHSVPTLLYFVDGNLRAKVIGTASKEAILAKLRPTADNGDSSFSTPAANET
jgi:thioredoxin 1